MTKPNVYLMQMTLLHKGKYVMVDTDTIYADPTAKVFCRLSKLPYKNAKLYRDNIKPNTHVCSDKAYGPEFRESAPTDTYWDVNCKKSEQFSVKSVSKCMTHRFNNRKFDSCDTWIWCQD